MVTPSNVPEGMDAASDPWLGGILGVPAWHLNAKEGTLAAALPLSPFFIDAKVPVERIGQLHGLVQLGFQVIEVNVQLCRSQGPVPTSVPSARFATAEDEAAVRDVAARAFTHDRFHIDPRTRPVADILKAEWAGNFFAGKRGRWMVVAEHAGTVAGFLQLLEGADGSVVIDLIGVAPEAQGNGLGTAMIATAAGLCRVGAPLRVGTQLANTGSLRLYQRLGFVLDRCQYVLHRHG